MGCNNFSTQQDDELLARTWAGEHSVLSPELVEKLNPEADQAIEQRTIECLREAVDYGNQARVQAVHQDPEEMEKIDGIIPPDHVYHSMWQTGKSIGMHPVEIVSFPVICGTSEVKDVDARISDTMRVLHDCKIPMDYWANFKIDKIVFVPIVKAGSDPKKTVRGDQLSLRDLRRMPDCSTPIRIYFNPETGQFPKGKDLLRVLAHEIFHRNETEWKGIIGDNQTGWQAACLDQLMAGGLPGRATDDTPIEQIDVDSEFMADTFAFWVTDHSQLCPDMKEFFDAHFFKDADVT